MNLAATIIALIHLAVVLQALRFFRVCDDYDHDRIVAATLGGLSATLVIAQLVGWDSAVWASLPKAAGAEVLLAFSFSNALVYLSLVTGMYRRATRVVSHD
jgi:hypothetical protein